MAEQAITQGSIRSIFEPSGCFVEHPVLQCVQIKPMEPKAGEANPMQRFRVVLSDIRNFIQTMIATTANDIVTSGKLKKGSIVRLLKYNPQRVKEKNILIIMELEVLEHYGEHEKIGQPEVLTDAKTVPQPGGISGDGFYGSKPAPAAAPAPQQRSIPVHQSNPATSTHPNLYPIESLSPYAHKWTIRARCTNKGDMKEWHNAKGTGKLFSVNLLDDTGEIRATLFNEVAERLYPVFEVGTVYYISAPCRVTLAKKQFSNLPNDYELSFERDTEVEKAEDQDNKPQIRFNFTKIGDLNSVEKDTTIDTVGVLKEVAEINTITSKTTNKDFSKRELTLADDSQTSVRLTIWGKTAESFEAPLESIIAFKGVKVSDFGGRSLSLLSSGTMMVDPDIDEAHKLRGWFNAVGQNATFSTHQNMAPSSGSGGKNESKIISSILEEESYLQDTPTYLSLRASVVYVKNTTVAYPACSTQGCNKKVIEDNPGSWWCEKCQTSFPEPQYRYVLSVNVADHTGTLWLSCFDEAGQAIVGLSANEAMKAKLDDEENDTQHFMTIMQDATCKTFNFRVRAKMETYQDQPKPRYQVLNLYPLNFAQEANKLAQVIKQYDTGDDSLFVN
ncbi:replication protein-like protein A 70 kDa DNA-binding subunit [Dothidotthia symphoricarpi CBS 119687]|uniref:Replication protein A subunit n=1 Tax=Dothidotthia symphoricarpi CBS 119687 TaxID=1392245 RepID=A0A6A6ART1_9PLEO|nr:replication protein-like protein A 70 kDa DNA-binding subunit [Dothidotthia symphoricarpi CBS 119687]KAF2134639.1 replication protein-like protein A 70 kDa DNA-binding subunit [Dothidotthia symphoricarpi CBS 119687]